MAFQKIRFLGGKLGEAIANEYDVSTVGDLLTITLEEMQSKFGENAYWVYELLRGVDRSEVREKSAQAKSMLASKNLPQPITNAADGHHWIRILAAELALRLDDARKTSPGLWPKTIVLHARKGYESARSKQAAFPFTRKLTVDAIAMAGDRLWKDLVGHSIVMKVTSVQLAFTGLEAGQSGQQSIEGFFKTPDRGQPNNDRQLLKRVRDEEDMPPQTLALEGESNTLSSNGVSSTSFTCLQCGKRFYLAGHTASDDTEDEGRAKALAILRMEHDDFHFAQDLAKTSGEPQRGRPSVTKKKRKERGGIEMFFNRK